jgi:hypothetical protein
MVQIPELPAASFNRDAEDGWLSPPLVLLTSAIASKSRQTVTHNTNALPQGKAL